MFPCNSVRGGDETDIIDACPWAAEHRVSAVVFVQRAFPFVNVTKSLRTRSSYRTGQVYVVGDRHRYLWFRLISYSHHETQVMC